MATDPAPSTSADDLKALRFGFDDLPLEHFRGMSAEAIEAHAGIGPKFRERIQKALAELAALEGASPAPAQPAATEHPPAPAHDAYLEPAAPGGGGPALLVMVLLVLAIIIGAVMITYGRTSAYNYKTEYEQAQTQIRRLAAASETVARQSHGAASEAALAAFQRAGEQNLGLAREHLKVVGTLLAQLKATKGDQQGYGERIQAAEAALVAADASLSLSTPQTQAQIEAACRTLTEAVAAIESQEARE